VEFDPADGLAGLHGQLLSLTNVPIERQKLMSKGRLLKEDAQLNQLKEGDKLMLMGTAVAPPKEPEKKIVFEEDLTDAQKVGVVKDILPPGLENLGNTCYMASTLQCLRAIPELRQALIKQSQSPSGGNDPEGSVIQQLGQLYKTMDSTTKAVNPMLFTLVFRNTFPQFAQLSNEGHPMQQDAEEALVQLMTSMKHVLKSAKVDQTAVGADGPVATADPSFSSSVAAASSSSSSSTLSLIDCYFGGELETRTSVTGGDESDATVEVKPYDRLHCYIENDTNFLFQGLKSSLTEVRELGGKQHTVTSLIRTLPRYLVIQMMRSDWRRDTGKKAKKLRRVDFPFKLDMLDFCAPPLRRQLAAARDMIKEEQDIKLGLPSIKKTAGAATASSSSSSQAESKQEGEAKMDIDAVGESNASSSPSPSNVLRVPTSGQYDLFALVTHKGRYMDAGHYISWAKQPTGVWLKFDDDKVSEVKEEDIKALAGGGDHHSAYLLFYRRLDDVERFVGKPIQEAAPAVSPTEKREATATTAKKQKTAE